jgi:hypothetical protein
VRAGRFLSGTLVLLAPLLAGGTESGDPDIDDFVTASEAFEREAVELRHEVDLVAEERYAGNRQALTDAYDRELDQLEAVEKRERQDAIGALERFLARHPADPRQTPEAMLKLAELYYEKSQGEAAELMRSIGGEYQRLLHGLSWQAFVNWYTLPFAFMP